MFRAYVRLLPLLSWFRTKFQGGARPSPFTIANFRRLVCGRLYLPTSVLYRRSQVTICGGELSFLRFCRHGHRYYRRFFYHGSYRGATSPFFNRDFTGAYSHGNVSVSQVWGCVYAILWYLVHLERNFIYRRCEMVVRSVFSYHLCKGASYQYHYLGSSQRGYRLLVQVFSNVFFNVYQEVRGVSFHSLFSNSHGTRVNSQRSRRVAGYASYGSFFRYRVGDFVCGAGQYCACQASQSKGRFCLF